LQEAPLGQQALTVGVQSVRAHPHGADADEQSRWSAGSGNPGWPSGGRHPVWRGCQHVYDPVLSAFLFSRSEG
jgi:hypothetical protein